MIQTLVLSSLLLTLPAQDGGRASSMLGGKAATKVEAAEGSAEALARYNELKAKTPRTVAAQSKLATWCEEHGLKTESYVHYAEVVRLDPRREAAWRKLGYRKYGNRWMTDTQIAMLEDQKKSGRTWQPQLKKIHKDIHGSNGAKKRDLARAAFEAIRDEKAIPSLYREFGASPTDQILLIQVLDRIETPLATRVMAMLAVYGQTPEVRRHATEILRGRSSTDYLELLVGLMVDTVKYEVKHVGGPDSPGVLFVEGEKYNVARFYAPPPPPNVIPGPGDIISYDRLGMPVITRDLGTVGAHHGVAGSKSLAYDTEKFVRFSATEMMMETQRESAFAEAQLEGDVSQIRAINDDRRHFNELVISVAAYATGKTAGTDPKDWRKAAAGQDVKKYPKDSEVKKPTITELVPLAYQPTFAQVGFMMKVVVNT